MNISYDKLFEKLKEKASLLVGGDVQPDSGALRPCFHEGNRRYMQFPFLPARGDHGDGARD